MGTTYSVYKLPYISSAIDIHTGDLQTCLAKAKDSIGGGTNKILQSCITTNISSKLPHGNFPIKYFGQGETVHKQDGESIINVASKLPNSNCYEKFDSNNDTNDINIESNKIFCFNGTFTILTIFVLILLLIFINVNTKNTVVQKSLL